MEQFTHLLDHLIDIKDLDRSNKDMINHIASIEHRVDSWVTYTTEDRMDAEKIGDRALTRSIEARELKLVELYEALLDKGIEEAVELLRGIIVSRSR